jgi:hypothetical protein
MRWCWAGHANRSAWLGNGKVPMMNEQSGPTLRDPFAYYDPATSSWRTSQLSLDPSWGESSPAWPPSGIACDGLAYELPTSALLTAATASSLLPTPEAKLAESGPDYARADRPESGGDDLTTAVTKLLPSPAARDYKGPAPETMRREGGTNLPNIFLPTPRATDAAKGSPHQHGSSGDLMLTSAVMELLPTPEASDGTGGRQAKELGGTRPSGTKRAITLGTVTALLPTPVTTDAAAAGRHSTQTGVMHPGTSLTDAVRAELLGSDVQLLPTPEVAAATGGQRSRSGPRRNELLLGGVATALQSSDGNTSPDGAPPTPPSSARKAEPDSQLSLWSG